jgi:phenylpyruvate tautomerase PptA (4-oxalocrotonate tautomerase family)
MPFVCIELPNKAPRDAVSHLRESIRTAIREHLATKDHKYDFVMIHEGSVSGEDVMVGLTVDLRPGRTDHQKRAFVDASCNAIRQYLGIKPENVYAVFREVVAANQFLRRQADQRICAAGTTKYLSVKLGHYRTLECLACR